MAVGLVVPLLQSASVSSASLLMDQIPSTQLRQKFSQRLAPLQVARKPLVSVRTTQVRCTKAEIREATRLEPVATADFSTLGKLENLCKLQSPQAMVNRTMLGNTKRHPYEGLHVGERWEEIHGADNWKGLLEPLDPVLRGELLRYGEFAQATYDTFDYDQNSKFCGSSKYSQDTLLQSVGLENRGYEVTDYLYATADTHLPGFFQKSITHDTWSKDSNWIGFVAVCTSPREIERLGRRDIAVVWRGTVTKFEWIDEIRDYMSPAGLDMRSPNQDLMVESGFLSIYKSSNERSRFNKKSAREQVLSAVQALVHKYRHEDLSISVTGHSLGSALATLCAYDIAASGMNKRNNSPSVPRYWDDAIATFEPTTKAGGATISQDPLKSDLVPISVFSFAGPRVGNDVFRDKVEELGVRVLRIVNKHDQVTKVPGMIFKDSVGVLHDFINLFPDSYTHCGVHLDLDNLNSPFLKPTTDPLNAHNLEAYLHLLDAYHSTTKPFVGPKSPRDVALVNKGSDFLKSELHIPSFWWQAKENKSMVRDAHGHWRVQRASRHPIDYPALSPSSCPA